MNAELTHWFILLLLLSAKATGQNVVNAQVQVASHTAREWYCSVGSRSANLLVTFDARIRNTSHSPIELSLPTYPVARVARSLSDLEHRKYEAILGVPLIEYKKDAKPDLSSATVIAPENTQEFQTMEITFPLSLHENTNRVGELGFGTHFVELEFEVRDGMTKHFVKTESQPIHLEIKKIAGLKPCR
jgi:hypothetical protein